MLHVRSTYAGHNSPEHELGKKGMENRLFEGLSHRTRLRDFKGHIIIIHRFHHQHSYDLDRLSRQSSP